MELETGVVQQDPFGYSSREILSLLEGNSWFNYDLMNNQTGPYCWDQYPEDNHHHPLMFSGSSDLKDDKVAVAGNAPAAARSCRRRRQRSRRNQEEIEKQRMTHITVERNRRKQMNEYLSSLRQLMPDSYVSRSDQASIIGSAINYVKELEQRLQFLNTAAGHQVFRQPFSDHSSPSSSTENSPELMEAAQVDVTMVENHANLKIRSRKRSKQLLKMVDGLQKLRLTVLHLNVTTVDQTVLYSLNLKVEDDCQISSGDEIASAVNQILGGIEEEASII